MSGRQPHGDKKRRRKNARAHRRDALIPDYRKACRAEIQRMRQHNEHAANGEDRVSPIGFRIALKRLRQDFASASAIAGRPARTVRS